MNISDIASLISLPINDLRIQKFLENNGLKMPKQLFLSNRKSERGYWIENKKMGYSLSFGIQCYNPKYPTIQADSRGMFVPLLEEIRWSTSSEMIFPFGIDFETGYEMLVEKLGNPKIKSSDISPIWRNDDGSESFYRWEKVLSELDDHIFSLQYDTTGGIRYISLKIERHIPLMELYEELFYEDIGTLKNTKKNTTTSDLFFLRWCILSGAFDTSLFAPELIGTYRTGQASIYDIVEGLRRGYILDSDIQDAYRSFVVKYLGNTSGFDIGYGRDFAYTFLHEESLKNNYLGESAQNELNGVEINDENFARIRDCIARRYAEYTEHAFEKSV